MAIKIGYLNKEWYFATKNVYGWNEHFATDTPQTTLL